MLSIEQILVVAFQAAKSEMLRGRKFYTMVLEHRYLEGHISFAALGPYAQAPDGSQHEVLQVSIPMTWNRVDEAALVTENARIQFVYELMKKAFSEHDQLVLEHLPGNHLVFSNAYTYDLGNVLKLPVPGERRLIQPPGEPRIDFYAHVYSAFSPIPLEHWNV